VIDGLRALLLRADLAAPWRGPVSTLHGCSFRHLRGISRAGPVRHAGSMKIVAASNSLLFLGLDPLCFPLRSEAYRTIRIGVRSGLLVPRAGPRTAEFLLFGWLALCSARHYAIAPSPNPRGRMNTNDHSDWTGDDAVGIASTRLGAVSPVDVGCVRRLASSATAFIATISKGVMFVCSEVLRHLHVEKHGSLYSCLPRSPSFR